MFLTPFMLSVNHTGGTIIRSMWVKLIKDLNINVSFLTMATPETIS